MPDLDPRYPNRYQRGARDEAVPDATRDEEPDSEDAPDLPFASVLAWPLLVVGTVLAAGAVGAALWASFDPSLRWDPGVVEPTAAARVLPLAPGPLAVAAVAAFAFAGGRLRAAGVWWGSVVPALATVVAAVATAVTVTTELRLISLTQQGPVSSGGIPLPEAAMRAFEQRIQTLGVLDALLPWLIFAVALGVVATVAVGTTGTRDSDDPA
jgi:hypothetical protein